GRALEEQYRRWAGRVPVLQPSPTGMRGSPPDGTPRDELVLAPEGGLRKATSSSRAGGTRLAMTKDSHPCGPQSGRPRRRGGRGCPVGATRAAPSEGEDDTPEVESCPRLLAPPAGTNCVSPVPWPADGSPAPRAAKSSPSREGRACCQR